jgi:hypothetical protein
VRNSTEACAIIDSVDSTLEQLHESLWLAEGEVVSFYGFPYPTRAVIVRLADGGLWVWSPVKLTLHLQAEVDRLGHVRHLVSPNKLHHLYLAEWQEAYPQALLWGPSTSIAKRRDLSFREPLEDAPPAEWGNAIDQAWFRGSIAMDEIVFFHRASGTVLVADLIEAFSDRFLSERWGGWRSVVARLDGITAAAPGAPREWRWSFVHRKLAREARDKVLGWDCVRVVMAHGEWVPSDGRAYLERAFRWLGS